MSAVSIRSKLFSSLGVILLLGPAAASTWFVDAANTSGANTGTSWIDSFQGSNGLQNALTAAQGGDAIWVARGTYLPTTGTSRSASFVLKNGVAIYGGFGGSETQLTQRDPVTNPTILSGDLAGDDGSSAYGDNSLHVVQGTGGASSTRLDGFTITGGNADGSGSGGGLLLTTSLAVIARCTFSANRCGANGAGGIIWGGSPQIIDCVFAGGIAGNVGGGLICVASATPTIDRCTFRGNHAARGSALAAYSDASPRIANSLFHANVAEGSFGQSTILLESGQLVEIIGCTITGNTATASNGGISTTHPGAFVKSCIVWGNQVSIPTGYSQVCCDWAVVTYSCIEGGFAGVGNTGQDPVFVDAANGDFRLVLGSSCIDAGDNASFAGSTLDRAGRARFVDDPATTDFGNGTSPIVDRGCFEAQRSTSEPICAGDGLGTACPCGNESAVFANEGCRNSLGVGAKLESGGDARVSLDTFVLLGSQMPNSSALYFQGTTSLASGSGLAFGDGLRCAGGAIARIATKTNVAGASRFPEFGDPSVSVRGAIVIATPRVYQVWYRNAAAFCTSATFNLTNALETIWEP